MIHSPSKLNDFLACPHLSKLEAAAAKGSIPEPFKKDPHLELLQIQGERHEAAYLESLSSRYNKIQKIKARNSDELVMLTDKAIKSGIEVIYQAALKNTDWKGYADFLVISDKASSLGDWSYSIHDTKLSAEVKGSAIVQLCIYSELLEEIQGCLPEKIVVVGGNNSIYEYDPNDFLAYVNYVKEQYLSSLLSPLDGIEKVAAEPVEKCHTCKWRGHCESVWLKTDHLKLVAGSTKLIRKELRSLEINTLTELGNLSSPPQLNKTSKETAERIYKQAKIQLKARLSGNNEHEFILPVIANQGLAGLPAPSEGDIWFDIEGDHFIGDLGLEYLLGWVTEENGEETYHHEWAMNNVEEKNAFFRFISFVLERKKQFPDLHVYHYGHYEATVVRRLSTRYNVLVDSVDELLRQEVFIDLHRVVKNGLRMSVTGYGLKDIEGHYDFLRDSEQLRQASMARKMIALLLDSRLDISQIHKGQVHDYNKEDCLSTYKLHKWLESRRNELLQSGTTVPRLTVIHEEKEEKPQDEKIVLLAELSERLYDKLRDNDGQIPLNLSQEQQAIKSIADLLLWYRREDKSHWWEYFFKMEMSREEMLEERKTLAGPFRFIGITGTDKKSNIYRWSYPLQMFDGFKSKLHIAPGRKTIKLSDQDVKENWFEFTRSEKTYHEIEELLNNATGLVASDYIPSKSQIDRLIEIGSSLIEDEWLYPTLQNLMLKQQTLQEVRKLPKEESVLQSAMRLALQLNEGAVLPIQGPPGTGKTYTAAHMICELVKAGKKVGITAQSHSVIFNLVKTIHKIQLEKYPDLDVKILKQEKFSKEEAPNWMTVKNNAGIKKSNDGFHVIAGTTWLWSSDEMKGNVDVLFIDEAGQFSLADAIACSQSGSSLVLLGDPQQLENVSTGVHPPEIQVSVLGYWLGESQVMPLDEGLFLNKTYRLSPGIREFISQTFYQGCLQSSEGLDHQKIESNSEVNGSGIYYRPCLHEGNQSSSSEEVECIKQMVSEVLRDGYWYNKKNERVKLKEKDIMIVAPYNFQVNMLKENIQNIEIGTVDKFQGKEAPLVIYSMTTSSQEEAPRGMEFLYSLNRLNVAMSRAQCMAILVASPALFNIQCRTPEQMKLANGFIQFLNMSEDLGSERSEKLMEQIN